MSFIGEACAVNKNAEAVIARVFESFRFNTVAQSRYGADYTFDFDALPYSCIAAHRAYMIGEIDLGHAEPSTDPFALNDHVN